MSWASIDVSFWVVRVESIDIAQGHEVNESDEGHESDEGYEGHEGSCGILVSESWCAGHEGYEGDEVSRAAIALARPSQFAEGFSQVRRVCARL